jgi:hypothetical protein
MQASVIVLVQIFNELRDSIPRVERLFASCTGKYSVNAQNLKNRIARCELLAALSRATYLALLAGYIERTRLTMVAFAAPAF